MTIFSEFYHLSHYEEVLGPFENLEEKDGSLIAKIGKIRIILPQSLEQSLRQLLGQRIAILRTDLSEKPYLFRLLDKEPTSHEKASVSEDCTSK